MRSRLAIRALSDALDGITAAKATKDAKVRVHMVEVQDSIVLAIYRLNPGWLSLMDETYLRARGLL